MDFRQSFLILLLAGASFAQDLTALADPFFTKLTAQNHFSGVVLIAKDGQPLFAKAYGYANQEHKVPNTLETRFRVGSITKQFTAAAVLKLAEQNKLKFDDKACHYLADCPPAWKTITIHQLLTHTAGLVNFTSLPTYSTLKAMPSRHAEQLKSVWDKPLDFDPGTKWRYSNTGYLLLGQIIEKAAGMPFEDYLDQEIFGPAGMTKTRIERPQEVVPHLATGYRANGGKVQRAGFIDMRIPGAAGAAVSTAEDLLRWDRALAKNVVISAESRRRMLTPEKGNYGYGTMLGEMGAKKTDGHNGGIDGFVSLFQRFTSDGIAVVALANYEDLPVDLVMPGLTKLALGQPPDVAQVRPEVQLDDSVISEYLGRYELTPQFSLTITREGTQLFVQGTGQPPIPVFAEAKDVLFPKVLEASIDITREDGKVTGLVLHQGGRDRKAKKVE